jgi:hypothetical protein
LEVRDDDRHRGAGCPVHEGFEPLSSQYLDDPFAIMAALPLEEAPVFFAPSIGYHVVTRHADDRRYLRELEELTARLPRLRLVEGQPLTFHPNISFRRRSWSAAAEARKGAEPLVVATRLVPGPPDVRLAPDLR